METFLLKKHLLEFTASGVKSLEFNDIFHSADGIIEEVNSVYIDGNNLRNRWQTSTSDFTIAELGFGFGISFRFPFCSLRINNPT